MFNPNKRPPNYTSLLSISKGIARCAYPSHPSTVAFQKATGISDNEKIRPFTSEAVCRPFSSCNGHTDIQTHSYGRE
jgi:hypothetical protein